MELELQPPPAPGRPGAVRHDHGEAWPREAALWHPVWTQAELGDAPVAVRLLERELVLWRDADGAVHAWHDRCPHRGARLSLGALHAHALQCPYHGWQFAGRSAQSAHGEGHCIWVPAQPSFAAPATHRCTTFEVRLRHGLVWVRLRAPDEGQTVWLEPPSFDGHDLQDARVVLCGPYRVQASPARLVENFLDLSHFGFVHAGWLGDAAHAQVQTGEVSEQPDRVIAEHCRAFQPRGFAAQADGASASGDWVAYRYAVEAPFCASLLKRAQRGDASENAIALFICPHGEDQVSAWFCILARNDATDDAAVRAFQDTVFAQDRPVLESQRPTALPIGLFGPIGEVHGPADRMSSAYRRLLLRAGIRLGVC